MQQSMLYCRMHHHTGWLSIVVPRRGMGRQAEVHCIRVHVAFSINHLQMAFCLCVLSFLVLCCAVLCCAVSPRDEPRKLLAVLTAADHPLAQHADSAAALQELGLLFDYLEVRKKKKQRGGSTVCCSAVRYLAVPVQFADAIAALQELGLLFDYLEVVGGSAVQCSTVPDDTVYYIMCCVIQYLPMLSIDMQYSSAHHSTTHGSAV
jgi:hypothetical protein